MSLYFKGLIMPTIKCPDCSGIVSDRADKCPHCGAPTKEKTGPTQSDYVPLLLLLGCVIAFGVYLLWNGSTVPGTAIISASLVFFLIVRALATTAKR